MSTRFERPPADLRARLLAATARAPATAPGAWPRRVVVVVLLALAWTVAAGAVLGPRADWRELPGSALAQTFVALLIVATSASAAGLTRGRTMVGAATEALFIAVWGGTLAVLALILAIDPRGPSTRVFAAGVTAVRAFGCDGLIVVIAAPLLAAGLWLLRGLTLARPAFTGACLGFAAATWAHIVVRFHCPVGGSSHAFLGHLLPALPMMAFGAWACRAELAQRIVDRLARR